MKCKDCSVPPMYDYQENCKLCGLFGWDNDDEHFKVYADGEDGCIHRKATIEKWYNEEFLELNGQTVDKETAKKFGLLNHVITIDEPLKIKKKCLCCGKEMELNMYEERDFCDRCFYIVCQEVFNKANSEMTVKEIRERIRRNIEE